MSYNHPLFEAPIADASQLGCAIPPSLHAVSVALPRWHDVVNYEEKNPETSAKLQTGYPRFVVHPLVAKLSEAISGCDKSLPFPSQRVAERAMAFARSRSREPFEVVARDGVFTVKTTGSGYLTLREFWQHTGLIVSSRRAEALLSGSASDPNASEALTALKAQLAQLYGCAPEDVFLTPSGMAAQWAALEAVKARSPGKPTGQLGFPYVDTLKLQEKTGYGGILLHHLETIEQELQQQLLRQPLAGCFCEIPGNPLLGCADLRRISPILRQARIPLVADDVVATPFNIDLSGHADLIATSLTKFVAGTGDVMAGALICNSRSPLYAELKSIVKAQHEELLCPADARVLVEQAKGFAARMQRHNANGLFIAERLRSHPAVERVWYPKWEFADAYEAVRRPKGGWGALVTFLPRNARESAPTIYDRLQVSKGPSLGTVFTLACPFTLLAHYSELAWAEARGVSRYLLRLSIGLEEPEELWGRISAALQEGKPNPRTTLPVVP